MGGNGTLGETVIAIAPSNAIEDMKRVAITGIGVVSPLGNDAPSTWEAAVAGAGEVGEALSLGDDAVEPGHLEPCEPTLGHLAVGRRRRDRQRELLHALASLLERELVDGLTVPKEEVERDEVRGNLLRELAHPALGGMEAHLQRVEVERAVACDDDLPVDRRVRLQFLAECLELGEITEEGAAVTAPEMELARHVLEDPAETVPFGLVLPAVRLGQLVD
jgi:hypothetical protein